MKLVKIKSLLGVTAPLLFVAACGGGSSSNSIEEPSIGEGHTTDAQTTAVAGRVADGYLQGAVVCVDINENGSCDEDEPQTVSGQGGSYNLDIPDDATDKPILAIVPATAIDEDTGKAIGKELFFSSPGDKPSFISPITTLVHQALKQNPTLNTDDAEAAVLETLGMPDEKDASLFADYVANSETGDQALREKFHYLHQTARVVATMMGDIHENVEAAAVENGIDVSSDAATQAAIRQLVEDEVRALLPEISAAVAEQISEQRSETDDTDSAESTTQNVDIDPDSIAEGIIVDEISDEIVDEIEAIKAEKPTERASMKDIMTEGFYLLDVDCEYADEYGPEDGITDDREEPGAVILHDDGAPGIVDIPEHCEANYSFITVAEADNVLHERRYYYDTDSATWVQDVATEDADEKPHMLVFANGKWVAASDDGPSGPVEFTEDGGAILNSQYGNLSVYATQRELDGTPVLHHLKARGAADSIADLVSSDMLFEAQSKLYKLHIKRNEKLTVLFNWYPEDNEDGVDHCAEFNGNCNVVGTHTDNEFIQYTSLADIQEGSLHGIPVNEVVFDHEGDFGIDIKLESQANDTNDLPESGTVSWMLTKRPEHNEQDDSTEESCTELDPGNNQEPLKVEPEDAIEAKQEQGDDHNTDERVCASPVHEPYIDDTKEEELSPKEGEVNSDAVNEPADKVIASSRWAVKVQDGISMIVIDVPVAIHHRMEQDEVAALLLIEQDGFVRRGARFSEQSVDDDVAYSEATFMTLQPIIEKYVGQ